jgi:GTP-binding protein
MQFLDEAKIFVKSGDGGEGCVSFRREKNIPFGGPDGGNGGKGGDVIIQVVSGLNTLIDFRYQQHFKASKGEHGKGTNRNGKSREPLIIKVPVGTQIIAEDGETLLYDLVTEGEEVIIAKGGDGGFGNASYKSSTNRAPRSHTPGWPGEEMWLWLRLKLISDVGLVGLPNAGKSTFLSVISSAKPKIADYPFTTLKPQLGVVTIDDTEFVVADIPGLIEKAHLGAGLGDKFLKHIERCRIILHLIDCSSENIEQDYLTIRSELSEYSELLKNKKEIIALSKADLLPREELASKMAALAKHSKQEIKSLSAVTGEGVTEILRLLRTQIDLDKDEEQQKIP